MAGKTLEMMVVLNGRVGNGIGEIGNKLSAMGAAVDQISSRLIDYGKESVEIYADYEQNLLDARGALSSQYTSAAELNLVMSKLDKSAQEWAATTKFHTSDVSLAISEAAHAGWSYEQMMEGLPQAMLLAQAGNLDLSTSLDYIIKSANATGMEFSSMGGFIDQWAMAANSSATNIDELGEAMLRMGSTMQFTDSTAELFTMLAVLANMGTVGSDAGTLLRNSMLRVVAPTDKAKKMFDQLGDVSAEEMAELTDSSAALASANELLEDAGFSAYDSTGKLKPMLQIFSELSDAVSGMSEQDSNEVLSAIFPTRTITGALNLLRAAKEEYFGLLSQITNSEGYAQQVSDIQMSGLSGSLAIFDSKLEELKRSVGEALAPQVEWWTDSFLGQFIDGLNSMDEKKLTTLVYGLEGIAGAGPALMGTGLALRVIGYALTPLGIGAATLAALAGGLSALSAYRDLTFRENFGTLALDIDALKSSLDGLSTETEDRLAPLQTYVDRLNTLAEQYQTAATIFSTNLATAVLSGKQLTPAEVNELEQYGQEIIQHVQSGIATASQLSQETLFAVTPDVMSPEEYEQYNHILGLLEGYYGDLEKQASDIGAKLAEALNTGLEDGTLDLDEQQIIQNYVDQLNAIEAALMERENAREYSRMLEKGQRVSFDSMGEYMTELTEYTDERVAALNDYYSGLMGDTRAALEAEQGYKFTDEEWQSTEDYRYLNSLRQAAVGEKEAQTSELATRAIDYLMKGSDLAGTWGILKDVSENGPRDELGNIDWESVDWRNYIHSEAEAAQFQHELMALQQSGGIGGLFGLGEGELSSMVARWANTPGMQWVSALLGETTSNALGSLSEIFGRYGTYTDESAWWWSQSPANPVYVQPPASTVASYYAPEQAVSIHAPASYSMTDAQTALENQGVKVNVEGDTTELQATIDGADGQTLMEYVDGDATNLSLRITDQDGQTLMEIVDGDTTAIANAINAFQGRVVTVTVRANNLLGSSVKGFATGGRADEPSIFGEAGAEWAIPERHDENTAQLLNAAREASGFSWAELLERGSSGGGTVDNRTFVYSPVIYAENAEGVEAKLREDKARLEAWWKEKQLRDEVEVFR